MGTIKRSFANNILTSGKLDATDLSGTIPSSNVADATLTNITSVPASVGDFIQSVASDPSPVTAGDVWYNTTSGTFKTALGNYGVWSSGGNLNTARRYMGGCGTQTAALGFGGYTTTPTTSTELYNGTSWTSNPTGLNTTRQRLFGVGTQTSALSFGGQPQTGATEKWNGTSWTNNPTGLNTTRFALAGSGTQTAALAFGGYSTTFLTSSESFNGTSWTNTPSLNTARRYLGGLGTQTSALAFSGSVTAPGYSAATESYDGISWTTVNSLNTAKYALSGSGISTAGLAFGGVNPPGAVTNATELWNGTSWTSSPNSLTTARNALSGAGTQTATVGFGGNTTAITAATEEWDRSVVVPVAGSWASGTSIPESVQGSSAAGTPTAALHFGGYTSGPTVTGKRDTTNKYNGTSWTSANAMNTARFRLRGLGTQTAALAISGINPSNPGVYNLTEKYDGTNWTATGNLNSPRTTGGVSGTQTAALMFGGGPPIGVATESFNGTSWTSLPANMNTARMYMAGCGTQTAALAAGGLTSFTPAPNYPVTAATESYNGTSWTSVSSLNTPRGYLSGCGTSTSGVFFGGWAPPAGTLYSATELWNGTSWTTNPNSLATARNQIAEAGSQTAALGIAGVTTVSVANTESWTGPSTTFNYKTITTS